MIPAPGAAGRHRSRLHPSAAVGSCGGGDALLLCAREDAFAAFDLALSNDLGRTIDGLIERRGHTALTFGDGTELALTDLGVLFNPRRMVATLRVAGLETRQPDPVEYITALAGVLRYLEADGGEPMATQDISVPDADAGAAA